MVAPRIGSHIDSRRHVTIDLEVRVQPPFHCAALATLVSHRGVHDPRQGRHQRRINQGECPHEILEFLVARFCNAGRTRQSVTQLGDDLNQPVGIEDRRGFRQRPQRRPRTAKLLLHVPQLARLLDGPQRRTDGIEQIEQNQQTILVVMQLAASRLITLTPIVMQPLEQRHQLIEILQPSDLFLGDPPLRRQSLGQCCCIERNLDGRRPDG